MANHKNKRSVRSPKRGKGKNHSVNRERSHAERKRARISKAKKIQQAERTKRFKLAKRLYMSGICDDYNEAKEKAFKVNKNFFVNEDQWF